MRHLKLFIPLIGLLIPLILMVTSARAAVTLTSLEAAASNDKIVITWKTQSELNNDGFYLYRSTQSDVGYDIIGDFFPSQGEGESGWTYVFTDTDVIVGPVYYYFLEWYDNNGDSQSYGPKSATLNPPTTTPTQTSTGGSTATSTFSLPGDKTPTPTHTPKYTPTRSATATITGTSNNIPPTPTQKATTPAGTSTVTLTVSALFTDTPSTTPTLIPLPKLTLLFPVLTPTRTLSPTVTQTATITPPGKLSALSKDKMQSRTNLLGGLIILIWILLGVFLVVYIRRLSRS